MVTSFFQYLLLAPSYINVLNVYFANVHDVSWGTKGDNKVSKDLGVVATGKDGATVEAAVPTDQKDINAAYEDAMAVLSSKPPVIDQKRDAATKQEDYYRSFRTNVLLSWTLSLVGCGGDERNDDEPECGGRVHVVYLVLGSGISGRPVFGLDGVHDHSSVCWRVKLLVNFFWDHGLFVVLAVI
ncbi:hypothetical protein AG1IA_09259 [Rhizoctonia solani AG-1 IA]|uniref:chitin synthase n=1 Tax=Thanatephorus cucumeris (strain AG1-IA) TaxID=983506 RepID=L8WEU7_THACA|nr:hypothetical protein AG1IA_09259 [Rhizoctonia solani AG-1 IA]